MDVQATVIELPEQHRSPMHREINRGLMVAWINRQLEVRAVHDVRSSIVLYDADGIFESALPASVAELSVFPDVLKTLFEQTNVRFYSKGI